MSKNRFRFRRSVLTIGVAAVLLISMVGMASADGGIQTWYLSSSQDSENNGEEIMYKGSPSGGINNVAIGPLASNVWIANETAEFDVDLSGNWTGILKKPQNLNDRYVWVEIGTYNSTSGMFESNGSTSDTFFEAGNNTLQFTITASDFTVSEGKYLAFNVTNNDTKLTLNIMTNGESYVNSPSTDPDNPMPELPTVILTGAGLLALAGFVVYRRRK